MVEYEKVYHGRFQVHWASFEHQSIEATGMYLREKTSRLSSVPYRLPSPRDFAREKNGAQTIDFSPLRLTRTSRIIVAVLNMVPIPSSRNCGRRPQPRRGSQSQLPEHDVGDDLQMGTGGFGRAIQAAQLRDILHAGPLDLKGHNLTFRFTIF